MYLISRPPTAPRNALTVCAAVSVILLAGAHLFESVGGLEPCLLCLEQREVHWAALLGVVLTLGLARMIGSSTRILAAALGAIALVYVFSAWLAGYHAGVEWGFWPGPHACAGGSGSISDFSPADLLAGIEAPAEGPSCDEAAWRMFGISMAGYNALISMGLAGLAILSAVRAARGLRRDAVGAPAASE